MIIDRGLLRQLLDLVERLYGSIPEGRDLRIRVRKTSFLNKKVNKRYTYEYVEVWEGYGGNSRFICRFNRNEVPRWLRSYIRVEALFSQLKGTLGKLRMLLQEFMELDDDALRDWVFARQRCKTRPRVLPGRPRKT